MKIFLFFALFITSSHAREVYNYNCILNSELNLELSVLDEKNPSLGLFYKNSKYGSCNLTTIEHNKKDPRAVVNEATWNLRLDACTFYVEKHKEKIKLLNTLIFKDGGRQGRYLAAVAQKDALFCLPLQK